MGSSPSPSAKSTYLSFIRIFIVVLKSYHGEAGEMVWRSQTFVAPAPGDLSNVLL